MMKFLNFCFFLLLFSNAVIAKSVDHKLSVSDSTVTLFKWDIDKKDKGTLMYLDVPFAFGGIKYATITVAKAKASKRPAFISFILPNNIATKNGLKIAFTDNYKAPQIAVSTNMVFTETSNAGIITRAINGYAGNGAKFDVFENFIKYKYLVMQFYGGKNEQKIVVIHLRNFQIQYTKLP